MKADDLLFSNLAVDILSRCTVRDLNSATDGELSFSLLDT